MNAKPTGHFERKADGLYLQFDRLFHAPIEDVWFSLTNPNALKAWIGTYTGRPETGGIRFQMTAEGEDAPWENVSVLQCEPPHRFHLDVGMEPETWRLHAHLAEGSSLTTLTFAHRLASPADAAEYGPGWDYYLDRLAAARAGAPLPGWDDYAGFSSYYRALHVPVVAGS
ncbi:SRPBCC family protein [Agromyces sp. LHK192]|uniref:SRPBCC family protein n=1 Tax=Agromyces sp. LHK192 TaxID=2498704 RepID=UPI000FD8F6C9|nr:SRPBCC family protein [Agromyces sp. LHK192]